MTVNTTTEPAVAEGSAAEPPPLLETRGLEVVYQDVIQALRGVSINVRAGSIVALLGPNGAGKTTTLRAITGLLGFHRGKIDKGSVHFDGQDTSAASASSLVARGVAQVLEGRRIFPSLTVAENIRVGGAGKHRTEDVERVIELFPVLVDRRHQLGGYLSGGEQQMLAMARALVSRPRLLVLDEPSLGLAPKLVDEVAALIVRINQLDTTVLLVEQNAAVALDVADHGYVIENGRVVMDAPSHELRSNEDIIEFYLGAEKEGGRRSYGDVKHYRRRKRWLS